MKKLVIVSVVNLLFASMIHATPESEGYHYVKLSRAQFKHLLKKYHCKQKFKQAFPPHFDKKKKINNHDQSIRRCFYLMDGWVK